MITHRVRHLCLANVLLALVSPVPAVFAQGSLDHLLCRRVTDSLRVDATADLLASQPAYTALGCRISRTSKLCVPVSKTNVSPPPPSAIAGPTLDGAYICYHLKCRVSSTTDVLADQFGSHQLKTVRGVSE